MFVRDNGISKREFCVVAQSMISVRKSTLSEGEF